MTGKVIARNEVTWQSVGQEKEEIAALRFTALAMTETKIPLSYRTSPFTKGASKESCHSCAGRNPFGKKEILNQVQDDRGNGSLDPASSAGGQRPQEQKSPCPSDIPLQEGDSKKPPTL
ncbi:hypothetical protein CSB09_00385 [Candidatus Gracilibacteria bacterium]|nr:MAG: hypothetical protein CSB09_00385 [Candidatus Gracilibacteria bacterium]